MKRILKERFGELGITIWYSILVLAVIAVVAVGAILYTQYIYPQILQGQRNAVEQSKSYTDSNNIALSNDIVQYNDPHATDNQQQAIINDMCEIVGKMAKGTVSPRVTKFLDDHGGCE